MHSRYGLLGNGKAVKETDYGNENLQKRRMVKLWGGVYLPLSVNGRYVEYLDRTQIAITPKWNDIATITLPESGYWLLIGNVATGGTASGTALRCRCTFGSGSSQWLAGQQHEIGAYGTNFWVSSNFNWLGYFAANYQVHVWVIPSANITVYETAVRAIKLGDV